MKYWNSGETERERERERERVREVETRDIQGENVVRWYLPRIKRHPQHPYHRNRMDEGKVKLKHYFLILN